MTPTTLRGLLPFATNRRVTQLEDALRELSDRVGQVEQGRIAIHFPEEVRTSLRDAVANLKVKNLEYRRKAVERSSIHDVSPSSVAPTSLPGSSATSDAAPTASAPEGTGAVTEPTSGRAGTHPCSCGCPDAYALTLGEVLIHRTDGPCYIALIGGES